jgi:hypothetical protein
MTARITKAIAAPMCVCRQEQQAREYDGTGLEIRRRPYPRITSSAETSLLVRGQRPRGATASRLIPARTGAFGSKVGSMAGLCTGRAAS